MHFVRGDKIEGCGLSLIHSLILKSNQFDTLSFDILTFKNL